MNGVEVGDVFLNRRSGHKWRVLRVGDVQHGGAGDYRMVTLRSMRSHNSKVETDRYLLNAAVHTHIRAAGSGDKR